MHRGRNPNSLKNLIPGGGAPKFKKGEKRSKESIEKQKQTIKEQKIIKDVLLKRLKVSDLEEIADNLIERAKNDSKDFETLQASIGQKPIDKILDVTNTEICIDFGDLDNER